MFVRARLPDRFLVDCRATGAEGFPVTDIDSRPRFRKLTPHASGVEDKRGREVYCDHHPEVRATWTGEWRPVSRIMFYPFNLCAECLDRARKGKLNSGQ